MNRETSIENWKNKKNNQININHFHEITNRQTIMEHFILLR